MQTSDMTLYPASMAISSELQSSDAAQLARLLYIHAPYDGRFELRIPGLAAVRLSHIDTATISAIYQPSLCVVAQGAKRLFLGQDVYVYDPSHMLVVAVDLPVAAQVIQASPATPFLSLRIDFDPLRLAELVSKVYPHGLPPSQARSGISVGPFNVGIVHAAIRLLELLTEPGDATLIAPLVIDEILIRLLQSPVGVRVAQLGLETSSLNKIARAVDWLRANYSVPINVAALASLVHMGSSSFHEHFKAVTSMSPVQYQKVLRLLEARRLMLTRMLDVGEASRQVGYLSRSQFSREYHRYFGSAPNRDIARLRTGVVFDTNKADTES